MKTRIYILGSGVLWIALCLAPVPRLDAAQPSPQREDWQDALAELYALSWKPVPGEPIDDIRLTGYLDSEGRRMLNRGLTLTNWAGKLRDSDALLKLPKPSSRTRKPEDIAARMESAVGVVGTFHLCDKCSNAHMSVASGFFVSDKGAFATCRHVLAGYEKNGRGVVVMTRDGRIHGVKSILACDRANDLLVLQVEGAGFAALPLAPKAPPPGSPVYVVSHPKQCYYMFTTGVLGRESIRRDRYGAPAFLAITADFAKGSSGAPVCSASGAVVGIVDNTESIYYTVEKERQENLQMVLKNCAPSSVLAQMLSGKPASERRLKESDADPLVHSIKRLTEEIASREWAKAESSIREIEKLMPPDQAGALDMLRFSIAIGKDDAVAAARFAIKVSDAHADNALIQNQLAWKLITRERIEGEALEMAAKIASRANEAAHGDNGAILDTLARVLFVQGQKDKAIDLQQQAVEKTMDPAQKAQVKRTLESYRKGELPQAE